MADTEDDGYIVRRKCCSYQSAYKKVYDDSELEPESTIKKYLIVQNEGVRQVQRKTNHYNLHQKITDLYATAIDYDKNAATTRRFYATVKMH